LTNTNIVFGIWVAKAKKKKKKVNSQSKYIWIRVFLDSHYQHFKICIIILCYGSVFLQKL
jgi:hypothetical protein